MYKGKEPCQGCGRPGTEKFRYDKNCLCRDCQEIYDKYKASEIEGTTMEYVCLRTYRFGQMDISSRGMNTRLSLSNYLVNRILEGFNNKHAKYQENVSINYMSSGQTERFIIPRVIYKALVGLIGNIREAVDEIREQQDAAFVATRTMIEQERTKIYNEGVEHGRKLLVQLNSGEITMKEFESKQVYKQ